MTPRAAIALLLTGLLLSACGANAKPEPPEGYQPTPNKEFPLDPLVKSDEAKKR